MTRLRTIIGSRETPSLRKIASTIHFLLLVLVLLSPFTVAQQQDQRPEHLRGGKTTTEKRNALPTKPELRGKTRKARPKSSAINYRNATLSLPLMARAGTHHLTLYVGQPPVKRTLIVDTGSRLTAWTCHPCPSCGKDRAHYDPAHSSTSSVALMEANVTTTTPLLCQQPNTTCHFSDVSACSGDNKKCVLEQRYTEGSTWEAYEVTDMITFGGVVPVGDGASTSSRKTVDDYESSLPYATIPFTFGCQTSLSGLFKEQYADGIMGFEHSNYSIFAALQASHVLEEYQDDDDNVSTTQSKELMHAMPFSMCLSLTGGWMGLGGALVERHLEPMKTTKLVKETKRTSTSKSKGIYAVTVTELWLGDTCLTCSSDKATQKYLLEGFAADKGAILDSGTTDTYLPDRLADLWDEAWYAQTGRRSENSTDFYSQAELERLPTMRIVLENNVTLTVPPSHYMEREEDKSGRQRRKGDTKEWTNRIYVDEPAGAVLGINAMLGHDILFDWQKGLVGVAPADCENR
jgi:hypothetical protein